MKPEDSQPEAENIEEMKEVENDKVVFTSMWQFSSEYPSMCYARTPNYMRSFK